MVCYRKRPFFFLNPYNHILDLSFTDALCLKCRSSWDQSAIKGSSKAEYPTMTMFRPQPSDGLTDRQSQKDSFLTAARLIRDGWPDERRQFTTADRSVHQPAVTKLKPVEIILKASSIRLVTNTRKTDEDKKMIPEQMTNKVKQSSNKEFLANTQRERPPGTVYFHVSGCRTVCRQTRRFKAPLLPVIAEI